MRQPTKSNLKRKETRRHTVQSGIDFSTLKRLKQLEQERDVLQQGLSYLEKANEWYMKQLETSNEKITLLGKGAPTSVSSLLAFLKHIVLVIVIINYILIYFCRNIGASLMKKD